MTDAGVPLDCRAWVADDAAGRGRPALFLDRDGVVVEETGYLADPAAVRLIPGAAETIARVNAAGLAVALVTNQSGIGRGYYGWAAFEAVQAEIVRRLKAEAGARLDAVFACAGDPSGGAVHPWRKPEPGMLRAAGARLGIDLPRSRIVGDKASDLEAGRAAGLAGGLLVATGHGDAAEQARAEALRTAAFAVMLAPDIRAAADWAAPMAGAGAPC